MISPLGRSLSARTCHEEGPAFMSKATFGEQEWLTCEADIAQCQLSESSAKEGQVN